jgi:hypothetical protein
MNEEDRSLWPPTCGATENTEQKTLNIGHKIKNTEQQNIKHRTNQKLKLKL